MFPRDQASPRARVSVRPLVAQRRRRDRRAVLVVEDEALIAMAVCDALEQSGYRPIGPCMDPEDAMALAEEAGAGWAVVDITLGERQSGLQVGRALAEAGVPVLYATGYGPRFRQEMEDAGGRGCLHKPYDPRDVPAALEALERLGRGQAPRMMPEAFHLFVD